VREFAAETSVNIPYPEPMVPIEPMEPRVPVNQPESP